MNRFHSKLNAIEKHILHKDLSLAFRQLVDAILDTKKTSLYKACIELTDWKDSERYEEQQFIERCQKLIHEMRPLKIHDAGTSDLVVANGITKGYRRGNFHIGPIDISVKTGEIWGLVGENGNGKTTLLRMLCGDLSFSGGNIDYPFSTERIDRYALRTKLTYIPQRTPKWYGSLMSNLQFTASHYGLKGEENTLMVQMMIIRFGLWKFRHMQWNELSSGYKMRFELARTFLRSPKLLLLDEPLANLDVLAQQLVLEDLKSLSQSISNPIGIILSSQQLFEVEKISDKVLFLRDGKPTFKTEIDSNAAHATTLIELDSSTERAMIEKAMAGLPLIGLHFNGGIYMIELEGSGKMSDVLKRIVDADIPVTYIRDISQSTRRLFVK